MNILNPIGGSSPFSGGMSAIGSVGVNLNLNIGIASGIPSDQTSLSGLQQEAYCGSLSNPLGSFGSNISSLGMGNLPGFNGCYSPMGSMFGGLMQQMQNQQQMMCMMMMMLIMMIQQKQNGFGIPPCCGNSMGGCFGGVGMGMPSASPGIPSAGGAASGANPNLQIPSFGRNPDRKQINQQLEAAAQKYGIPPNILKAVAWQESAWKADAKSFDGQHGKGVMQIDDRFHQFARTDAVWDSSKNIDYGARFLADLYKKTGDWSAALKRYNGGSSYPPKILRIAQEQPWNRYLR